MEYALMKNPFTVLKFLRKHPQVRFLTMIFLRSQDFCTFTGSHQWIAKKSAPADGRFLAFYVTMHYENAFKSKTLAGTFEFTTGVSVVPDIFPFEDCSGDGCLGSLV